MSLNSKKIKKKNSFLSRPILNTLVKLSPVFYKINQFKVKLFAKEPVIDQELPALNSLFKVGLFLGLIIFLDNFSSFISLFKVGFFKGKIETSAV